MQIRTPRDLGTYVRGRRKRQGITQAMLAGRVGVSRPWLSDLEAGKRTLEIGLVLATLDALGTKVVLHDDGRPPAETVPSSPAEGAGAFADLEIPEPGEVLERLRSSPRGA